ncbi:helix-turn-helix domain-containing protein [Cupriavidus basilensis]|uniref:helix-turn-helix domain-containing protein n=1 Tax=Cupriavidus basilensis TaxID=68895 RepID=UPI0023E7A5B1|nr:helix-turn-helix domain-containing protein [Cupriavidus basilensis]MDF3885501.1 helix-turn-helix domain-containing protein [Cupriavidus basilensis]
MPTNYYRMAPYACRLLDQALSGSEESATHTVRQVVVAMLPGGRCTSDQVAKHLGVDRRTLHRRLSAEGTNFLSLLQLVRAELASLQILDSDRPLAELADLLGFSSSSAFTFWEIEASLTGRRRCAADPRLSPTAWSNIRTEVMAGVRSQ